MSAQYVRDYYKVDYKRGERLVVDGRAGTLVSFPDQYLGVRFDGEKHVSRCHPTWKVSRETPTEVEAYREMVQELVREMEFLRNEVEDRIGDAVRDLRMTETDCGCSESMDTWDVETIARDTALDVITDRDREDAEHRSRQDDIRAEIERRVRRLSRHEMLKVSIGRAA